MASCISRSILALVILTTTMATRPVHAQTSTLVPYFPGWNMAGAPPGTDLSVAQALYAYGPNGYLTPPETRAVLCQGYWLDARVPAHWLLNVTGQPPAASTQQCSLRAGWTMVGNPFLTAALLPSGTIAYSWTQGRYETVAAIPLGGAVWIYSEAPGSISLRAAPDTTPALTASIPPGAPLTPYQLHVGQTFALSAREPFVLSVDAHFLALQAATTANGVTSWRYRALTPGTTSITATLPCYYIQPACLAPSLAFSLTIRP